MENVIDLNGPEIVKDRRKSYRALRTNTPIAVTELDGEKVVVLTRYRDVDAVLRDPRAIIQPAVGAFPSGKGTGAAADFYRLSLPEIDAPIHTKLRRILSAAFAPQSVSRMETWVVEIVERLLNEVEKKSEIDVVRDVGHTFATDVMCRILHVPRQDGDVLTSKIHDLVLIFSQNSLDAEVLRRADNAARELFDYFGRLLSDLDPLPSVDVMGALIAGEKDGSVEHEEAIALIINVLLGNYHTTVVSVTNAINSFAQFPQQRRLLIAQPDLAALAWEEVLRFEAPVHFRQRYLSAPLSLGDVEIEPGVRVLLGLASANWDETIFENPDAFDISRPSIRQLAFGGGGHFCLGALISRLEGRVLLPRFLSRFRDYRVVDVPPRNSDLTFPYLDHLTIDLGRSH